MKFLKKKQNKPIWFSAALCVVLVAATSVVLLSCNKENSIEPPVKPSAKIEEPEVTEKLPEYSVIERPDVKQYKVVELVEGQIETPYCTLNYPEGLADLLLVVNTSEQPYTLEFYITMEDKQELRLFDVSFGENFGGNMGQINTLQGEVSLNVNIYELTTDETWSDAEVNTAYAMQDVVNDIINQLLPENGEKTEVSNVIKQPEVVSTVNNIEIETPHGSVFYPARWANNLHYVHDDSQGDIYKLHFYTKIDGIAEQHLFSIYFGGDEGEQLGAVIGKDRTPVPVYLIMGELQLEGLDDDVVELICTLQEACNQLIERLPILQ